MSPHSPGRPVLCPGLILHPTRELGPAKTEGPSGGKGPLSCHPESGNRPQPIFVKRVEIPWVGSGVKCYFPTLRRISFSRQEDEMKQSVPLCTPSAFTPVLLERNQVLRTPQAQGQASCRRLIISSAGVWPPPDPQPAGHGLPGIWVMGQVGGDPLNPDK